MKVSGVTELVAVSSIKSRVMYKLRTTTSSAPAQPTVSSVKTSWSTGNIVPDQTYPFLWGCELVTYTDNQEEVLPVQLLAVSGVDANLLAWVQQWDGSKAQMSGNYVLAGGIYAGTKPTVDSATGDLSGTYTGIVMGHQVVKRKDGTYRTGIFAFDNGRCVVGIDPVEKLYQFCGRVVNGDEKGERAEMDNKRLSFFDASNNLVNELTAEQVTPGAMFNATPLTFTLTQASGSQTIDNGVSAIKIGYYNGTARSDTFKLSVKGTFTVAATITSGTSVPPVIFTSLVIRAYSSSTNTSSVTASSPYVWEQTIGSVNMYNAGSVTLTDPKLTISTQGNAYRYALFIVTSVQAVGTSYASKTITWRNGTTTTGGVTTNNPIEVTTDISVYRSIYGANGYVLGISSQNYMAMYQSGLRMLMETMCDGRGFKVELNTGFSPYYNGNKSPFPVCLFAGRVSLSWSGNTASSPQISGQGLGGSTPTVSLSTSTGITISWSSCAWHTKLGLSALDASKLLIQATPFGRNSGGSSQYDTALAISSFSATQCEVFTSNDNRYSGSAFFIRIDYLL